MAHSFMPPAPTSLLLVSVKTQTKKNDSLPPNAQWSSCHQLHSAVQFDKHSSQFTHRRAFVNGLIGSVTGWPLSNQKADAAKRPPPPPPKEKNDPSVTGLRAKLLASIKRKEAMKEEIAKQREKGKSVN